MLTYADSVDVSGFEKEMAAQKARSREAAKSKKAGDGVDLALGVQETAWLQNNKIAPTGTHFTCFTSTLVQQNKC
jgi:hypothetical protein